MIQLKLDFAIPIFVPIFEENEKHICLGWFILIQTDFTKVESVYLSSHKSLWILKLVSLI